MHTREVTQPIRALTLANEVRVHRAKTLKAIRRGKATIASVLDDPHFQTLAVEKLLRAIPTFGPVKIAKTLKQIGAAPSRKLGDLQDWQREKLIEVTGR